MTVTARRCHLISLDDLGPGELDRMVRLGVDFAERRRHGEPLSGAVVGIYFRKTSTRTRTSFSVAALRLGARIISFGPDDLQEKTGESSADTGRVLARMLDGLVARTAGSTEELRAWAQQESMSVINAMSAAEHPTQAVTDLITLHRRFGGVTGRRVLYLGEGNNTAAALALGLARFPGTELHVRTPEGYGLAGDILARSQKYAAETGAFVEEQHDLDNLPDGIDAVYTTRWQTTGTTKPDPHWRSAFVPFRVHSALFDRYPDAAFMHDLPAHRGDEVTAEVLDGPRSIAFDQAENKVYAAMAVLEWCLRDG
jgi:ornithine carbamoyltransferase